MATFAQQLIQALEDQGVKRIYGLVGDSLNPITDAIADSNIEWVHVHNEESAAFAAGAESLTTGDLAVCAGSCGPGNTHFIQGLFDAHRNGAKVLALASHIPSVQIGTSFFQETNPEALFEQASGYVEMVNSPLQGTRVLHNAIASTMAGNGVSVMVLPGDIASEDAADDRFIKSAVSRGKPTLFPDSREAAELAAAINEAETVTLFCGAGVKDARDQVLELAEKIKAPIGHALGGKMHIQYDNPFDVGMSGLLGYGAAATAMEEADLLILLGTDFPYQDWLPSHNVAQVDVNGAHIGRRTTVKYPVVGDVRATIESILPHVEEKTDTSFLDDMLKRHTELLESVVDKYSSEAATSSPIHPEYLAGLVDKHAADDAIFTVDTGMCNVWAARYVTPNGKRQELGSFKHGTMANALPQAIGAQAANPERQVVSMHGDGGLSMLLGELLTVKLHQLPIKMVVFNNASLGMVKLEMMVAGMPNFGTDHERNNFADIANAMGIQSVRVEDPVELEDAIATAFASDGPYLVEVVTDPDALSLPPEITWDMLLGFSQAATRTVFGGGVGEMLGLARSNLRHIGSAARIGKNQME